MERAVILRLLCFQSFHRMFMVSDTNVLTGDMVVHTNKSPAYTTKNSHYGGSMNSLKSSTILGICFVLITGTLSHFVYEWTDTFPSKQKQPHPFRNVISIITFTKVWDQCSGYTYCLFICHLRTSASAS